MSRTIRGTANLIACLTIFGLSSNANAYSFELEKLGCGGTFFDFQVVWESDVLNEYAKLEKATKNIGPWTLVATNLNRSDSYGPVQRRRWYQVWWCNTSFCHNPLMVWVPTEPCG